MNFGDVLQVLMNFIKTNLYYPVYNFIDSSNGDTIFTDPFKIGLGQVVFIETTLENLILLAIGLMVSITALVLTWKFLKMLTRFVYRLFGGIRK